MNEKPTECKGLFFRAQINCFESSRGDYYKSLSLKKLKRKSCQGCKDCDFIKEAIHECDFIESIDLKTIITGACYNLHVDYYFDLEEGYANDWEFSLIEIKQG